MTAVRGTAFAGDGDGCTTGGSPVAPRGIFLSKINTATVCSSKTKHFTY